MYKLENNVEWTDELKNAFKKGITRAQIVQEGVLLTEYEEELLTESGENLIITKAHTEENTLKELELQDNRYVPDVGFIGQATAKQLTVTLFNQKLKTNFVVSLVSSFSGAAFTIKLP